MITISGTQPLLSIFQEYLISYDAFVEIIDQQDIPVLVRPPEELTYVIKHPYNELIEALEPTHFKPSEITVSRDPTFFSIDLTTLTHTLKLSDTTVSESEHLVFSSRYPLELLSSEAYVETTYPNLEKTNFSNFLFFQKAEPPKSRGMTFKSGTPPSKKRLVKITPDLLYVAEETKNVIIERLKDDPDAIAIEDHFSDKNWMSPQLKDINRISKKHEEKLLSATPDNINEIENLIKKEVAGVLQKSSDSDPVIYCTKLIIPKRLRDPRHKIPTFKQEQLCTNIDQPSELLQFTNWLAHKSFQDRTSNKKRSKTKYKSLKTTLQAEEEYNASPKWANALALLIAH